MANKVPYALLQVEDRNGTIDLGILYLHGKNFEFVQIGRKVQLKEEDPSIGKIFDLVV